MPISYTGFAADMLSILLMAIMCLAIFDAVVYIAIPVARPFINIPRYIVAVLFTCIYIAIYYINRADYIFSMYDDYYNATDDNGYIFIY